MGESLRIEREHKLNVEEKIEEARTRYEGDKYTSILHMVAVESVNNLNIFPITTSCDDLGKCSPFPGVYLIYYVGKTSLYGDLIRPSQEKPMYIGMSRKSILKRLTHHCGKVKNAKDLKETDFFVRFMILDPNEKNYALSIEGILQEHYCPLWNDADVQFSFGNAKVENSNWHQYHVAKNEDKRKEMIERVRDYNSRTRQSSIWPPHLCKSAIIGLKVFNFNFK